MTPLTAVLASLVAAAPSTDVVVTRSVGADDERMLDVASRQGDLLTLQGIAGVNAPGDTLDRLDEKGINDPTTCAAKRPCVAQLGRLLGSTVVVSIDLGVLGERIAFSVEAVSAKDGRRLAHHQALLPAAAYPGGFVAQAQQFAEKLKAALAAEPGLYPVVAEPPPADAPVATTLVPAPLAQTPIVATEVTGTRRTLAWTATGAAVATGGAAVVLAAMGLGAKGQLDGARYQAASGPASTLKRAEAEQLAATANTQLSIALTCAVTSAVLTGVAALLWAE